MKSNHVKVTFLSFLLFCTISTLHIDTRVSAYEFENFADFLTQYGAAASEDKPLVIEPSRRYPAVYLLQLVV